VFDVVQRNITFVTGLRLAGAPTSV